MKPPLRGGDRLKSVLPLLLLFRFHSGRPGRGCVFQRIQDLPGRYTGGTIWVAEENTGHRDGVSPVIISSHDWAGAWASTGTSNVRLQGGPRQGEMSLRAGVNLIMYALTGNYKDDQVHVPHILERLGQ